MAERHIAGYHIVRVLTNESAHQGTLNVITFDENAVLQPRNILPQLS